MPADRYVQHYALGLERDRLSRGRGRLERHRTQTVLKRHLPLPPARVLDVGGAARVHARWLADMGYDVTLLDPVQLHLDQARAEAASGEPFTVREGDARALPEGDASYDAWQQVVDIAERLEHEPGFLGVSSHLLAVGRVHGSQGSANS